MTEEIPRPQTVDELLEFQLIGAHKRNLKNERAAADAARSGSRLAWTTAFVSALTATTVATTLSKYFPGNEAAIQLAALLISVASAVLATVNASRNFAVAAQGFRARAGEYKAAIRTLEMLTAFRGENRRDVNGERLDALLRRVEQDLNGVEVDRNALVVPVHIDRAVDQEFETVGFIAKAQGQRRDQPDGSR